MGGGEIGGDGPQGEGREVGECTHQQHRTQKYPHKKKIVGG